MLFYVNIQGSKKQSGFLAHPVYTMQYNIDYHTLHGMQTYAFTLGYMLQFSHTVFVLALCLELTLSSISETVHSTLLQVSLAQAIQAYLPATLPYSN